MVSISRALRADRDRFERVLEASGLGLWELDLDSGEFHVDAGCERNLGYAPGALQAGWETGVAIIHPADAVRVSRLFEAHLRGETDTLVYETRMLTQQRTWTWVAGHGRIVRDAQGHPTHVSGTLKNVDDEHSAREKLVVLAAQLRHQALHDPLTALTNRRGFEQQLDALLRASRDAGGMHALCYLDLDHFKVVNDTCGHAAGDELLRQLPPLLAPALRDCGELARIGGDEFAILLRDCPLEEAARIAEALRDAVRGFRFRWQQRSFSVGASIGVVAFGANHAGRAAVLAAADAACYVAKERGPNHVHVSYPNDLALQRRRSEMRWVARIKHALEEDLFCLHYMSIAALTPAGGPHHHELLLRLTDVDGGLIGPDVFLPVAERYQLMPQVDRWVLEHSLRFIGALAARAGPGRHCFGVNLSGDSLRDPHLADLIEQLVAQHRVPPSMLYFEFTETAAIANLGAAVQFMRRLRTLGCSLALDDFGSGMSSFTYLKNLPVDFLKIDGGFIRDIVHSKVDQAIVRAVQSVGAQMGIATIAEYVEDAAIEHCLRQMGVHYAQCYSIARPLPIGDFSSGAGPQAPGGFHLPAPLGPSADSLVTAESRDRPCSASRAR